ncbi:hypothetical protein [Pseudomonas sp. TMB3-21]
MTLLPATLQFDDEVTVLADRLGHQRIRRFDVTEPALIQRNIFFLNDLFIKELSRVGFRQFAFPQLPLSSNSNGRIVLRADGGAAGSDRSRPDLPRTPVAGNKRRIEPPHTCNKDLIAPGCSSAFVARGLAPVSRPWKLPRLMSRPKSTFE